jgi:hypothetical protein
VWIDISNRVQMQTSASGASSGSIVGPGFNYDNSVSIGIAYSQANGWTTIQDRSVSFTQRAPSIDLRGSAAFKATVILDVKFSLFSAWNINLKLKPWVSAALDFAVSSCGGAVKLAMQVGLIYTSFVCALYLGCGERVCSSGEPCFYAVFKWHLMFFVRRAVWTPQSSCLSLL